MILKYLSFGISLVFISFIIGMIITALIRKTEIYNKTFSNLNFIKDDAVNSIIGVGIIKWIVKNTFVKFLNPKLKIEKKLNVSNLSVLRSEMTKAEIDHLFAFIFVLIFVFLKLYKQEYLFALVILLVNVLMNLYPSLIQQQNKRRLDKLINKLKK